jgi:predicted metalloprotease
MRWQSGPRSGNIQDRRGRGGMIAGGGIGAVVLTIVAMLLGVDPGAITTGGGGPAQEVETSDPNAYVGNDEEADFVSAVLKDTETTWNDLFARQGGEYQEPQLVLFENFVQSACGTGQSAMGPFYCPLDQHVYLDMSFFRELSDRFGAPGDFARAYVIAHEIGHHVQTLQGISDQVRAAQQQTSEEGANQLQVRMELQADCYAGVWGHHARTQRDKLDPDDVGEAMAAAAAIGDDRLQREAQGHVQPESFTHGTSEQRMQWFRVGFESGDPARCNTFRS